MSNLVQYIEYVGEADLFAKEINQSDDGMFCLLLCGAKISPDFVCETIRQRNTDKPTDVEIMVLEAMEKANATAPYTDILLNDGQFSSAQACPSYFSGLLNSGLIIQSPIFVKNNERLKLEYNPNIKVFHSHNYLRQIERTHRIIHIPELLYSMSVNHEMMLNIRDDLKILNG